MEYEFIAGGAQNSISSRVKSNLSIDLKFYENLRPPISKRGCSSVAINQIQDGGKTISSKLSHTSALRRHRGTWLL